jgi:MarR family transcriptional regulator, lower aerobic nicotinate degradation pathway regulator
MDVPVAHPDYLSYRVKRLYMLVAQRLNDALKPYGLARSQWQVLSRVSLAGALSQKDLQHAMQVESATLTGIVDVLAAKGWLERLESPSDKRCRVLQLTPDGRELMARIPDPYEAIETRMLGTTSVRDRAHAERELETMISNLEDRS